jgi:hypothetical protein
MTPEESRDRDLMELVGKLAITLHKTTVALMDLRQRVGRLEDLAEERADYDNLRRVESH